MKVLSWTAFLALSLAASVAAQEGWSETRFHRVYLRNGNFLDGILVQDTPTMVILKMPKGEFSVRKDQIALDDEGKYRVEFVKIRTYNERAKREEIRKEEKPDKTEAAVQPSAAPDKREWSELTAPTGTPPEQMATLLQRLKDAPNDKKPLLAKAITDFGREGALFLANNLPMLDVAGIGNAAFALQQARDADTLPVVRKYLTDRNPILRLSAAEIVPSFADASDVPRLRPMLKDGDPLVRAAAVVAMGKYKDRDSFNAILGMLSDPDALVRKQSMEALNLIAVEHDLKQDLQRAISETLETAKGAGFLDLIRQVAASKQKSMGPLLAKHLANDDPMIRAAVLNALADLDARDTSEQILRLFLTEREYWPRIQLAGACGRMKLLDAIDPLLQWMADNDVNIKTAASRSLREITGQNFGINDQAWRDWWEKAKPK